MQEREREVPAKEQNVNAHNDDLFQQFDFVQVVSGQSKIMVARVCRAFCTFLRITKVHRALNCTLIMMKQNNIIVIQ